MKLAVKVTSERGKEMLKTGNDFITVNISNEDRKNIAQLNVFYNKENDEIVTTFVPLHCQESENGMAKENKTRRYYTAN